jgi:prevent-host-death family protein
MKSVNIHQAKTHLSRLVEEAARGEEIIIAKAGKPMVRLVPVTSSEGSRPLGSLAGRVRESEGWWAPDREIEALFYGDDEARGPAADPPGSRGRKSPR